MATSKKRKDPNSALVQPPLKVEGSPAARAWPHGPNAPREGMHLKITPEIAAEWLKANTRNRPIEKKKYTAIVRALRSGGLVDNGDPIRWSWSPETGWLLASGQHRLKAVAETGIGFVATVLFIAHEARRHVDDHTARTPAAAWMCETGEQINKDFAARVNIAWRGLTGWQPPKTSDEFSRAYNMFKDGIAAVSEILTGHAGPCRAPYVAAFAVGWYLDPEQTLAMAREYRAVMFTGKTPARALYMQQQDDGGNGGAAGIEQFRYALNLVDAHIRGVTERSYGRPIEGPTLARYRRLFAFPREVQS